MKKYSSAYYKEKQAILESYVKPFIKAIEEAGLPKDAIIEETMRQFQGELSSGILLAPLGGYLDDIANAAMPDQFKQQLLAHAPFKEAYVNLGHFYLNTPEDIEENEAEANRTKCLKRTIVRELLHEVLHGFTQFTPASIDTNTELRSNVPKQTGALELMQLPRDIQLQITGFLQNDPQAMSNFEVSCKYAYGLQKSIQDSTNNLYFTLTKPITLTSAWLGGLRPVTKQALMKATKLASDNTPITLFKSFHDAVEYAHSCRKFDSDFGISGSMPGVMTVLTKGDSSHLQFVDKVVIINPGTSAGRYTYCKRKTSVSCSKVPVNMVVPIAVVSLYEHIDFGNYRVLHQQPYLFPRTAYDKRAHDAFIMLRNKANDLSTRRFRAEAKKLNEFTNTIEKQKDALLKNLRAKPREYKALITSLREEWSQTFKLIHNELNGHRGFKHHIIEGFLCLVTAGIYCIALMIKGLCTNKFTFFSTSTGNKLHRTQNEMNHYLDDLDAQLSVVGP